MILAGFGELTMETVKIPTKKETIRMLECRIYPKTTLTYNNSSYLFTEDLSQILADLK